MDAEDAQAECSWIIKSTNPSGSDAQVNPSHQVTGLMLVALKNDDGNKM